MSTRTGGTQVRTRAAEYPATRYSSAEFKRAFAELQKRRPDKYGTSLHGKLNTKRRLIPQ